MFTLVSSTFGSSGTVSMVSPIALGFTKNGISGINYRTWVSASQIDTEMEVTWRPASSAKRSNSKSRSGSMSSAQVLKPGSENVHKLIRASRSSRTGLGEPPRTSLDWFPRAKEKQPYSFGLATGSVFAFAGLWDRWRDAKNNTLETCTILTTPPNSLVADVHDRMSAILRAEDHEVWLDPGITDANAVVDCLKPFDASLMKKYPVSTRVNRPENDDEECAREVSIQNVSMTLF